jgi:hypothetical protein
MAAGWIDIDLLVVRLKEPKRDFFGIKSYSTVT